MYTLLGRVMLGLFVDHEFEELHLALLLPHHRSGRRRGRAGHAEGGGAGRHLAVRLRLAVLAARRASLILFAVLGLLPKVRIEPHMERNFYYIGIAFFGMINGIFNPLIVLSPMSGPRSSWQSPLFGCEPLIFYFASLMALDRHRHPRRHSRRDL